MTKLFALLLPMALVGGALAVWLGDGVLSLGSLVGFLTVFGIAARNGILMISHFQHLERNEGEAFGPGLPVLYSELGVETEIPPGKAHLYEGEEPGRPVDEATQARFYRRALELARCQEGVAGLLLFHSHDEPFLTGFQSGVYYVDGTPKTSLEPVR